MGEGGYIRIERDQRRLEVLLDHVVAKRVVRTGMSIISVSNLCARAQ